MSDTSGPTDGASTPWGYNPTPGAHGPHELLSGDVQAVSRALLLLVSTFERITFETASAPPPRESEAYRLWQGAAPEHGMESMLTMQFANLSAFDHLRAYVALIRTPTVRSTALATVARGAHESLARTWYLLTGDTEDDSLHRVISLLRSDLRIAEYRNEPLRTRNGDDVSPSEKRQEYLNELARLELPAPAKVDLSELVSAMLDSAYEDDAGRDIYSGLSGVAHGQRHGLNNFVVTTPQGEIAGLAAPRAGVVLFASQLMAALYTCGDRYIRFYGSQPRHLDLFSTAWRRAYRTMEPITSSIWPDE